MDWLIGREPVSAWTHGLWLVLSLPGSWCLWRLSRGDRVKQVGMLIFGAGLALCYGGSYLYHAVPDRFSEAFNVLDHVGIYALIAGTVTPVALIVLRGWWRAGLLTTTWLMALAGIVVRLSTDLPLAVRTGFYLLMGWVGCVTYAELVRHLSHTKVRPIWLGGLFYSVGAFLNVLHWPALAPGAFTAHDLFHLFVMAGSLCHYYFMLAVLVPYRRPQPAAVPAEGAGEPGLPFRPALAPQPAEG
jgi:hemolysin III